MVNPGLVVAFMLLKIGNSHKLFVDFTISLYSDKKKKTTKQENTPLKKKNKKKNIEKQNKTPKKPTNQEKIKRNKHKTKQQQEFRCLFFLYSHGRQVRALRLSRGNPSCLTEQESLGGFRITY